MKRINIIITRLFPPGTFRLNCLAALISAMAFSILILNFQATPVGAGFESESAIPQTPSIPQMGGDSGSGAPNLASQTGADGKATADINRQIHSAIHGSRLALQLHVALLEIGKHRLEQLSDYSATFIKQERMDGEDLQEMQTMNVKIRHKPFSVYLKWIEGGDTGREILFVEGEADDKMLVRLGGLKGKLVPPLKLDPRGSTALKEARHPVTELGLLELCKLCISYRKRDLQLKDGIRWEMFDDQKVCDRDCYTFAVEYTSKDVEPVYRKSITYIDKEWSLPICVRNFGWLPEGADADPSKLDENTNIEFYGYKDIRLDTRLSEADFDKTNKEYTFKR